MIFTAVDQASEKVGFAIIDSKGKHKNAMGLEQPGRLLDHGTIISSGQNRIQRIIQIVGLLCKKAEGRKSELFVIEGHVYKGRHLDGNAIESLAFCTGYIELQGWLRHLPEPVRLPVTKWKKKATGKGNATKEYTMGKMAEHWGIPRSSIIDDNDGDALGIGTAWLNW